MFKVYSRSDIMEKISDKVKCVEDLSKLSRSEFDREFLDYWYNEYLTDEEYQDQGYTTYGCGIESFYYAFYLMECREECKFLVLVQLDSTLYFIFDPCGLTILKHKLSAAREVLLSQIADLTLLLPSFDDEDIFVDGYDHFVNNLSFVPDETLSRFED